MTTGMRTGGWRRRFRRVVERLGAVVRQDRFDDEIARGLISVGRHSYGRPNIVRYASDAGGITIGSFTSIADDVTIIAGGNHHPEWVSTFPFRIRMGLAGAYADGQPWSKGDVAIGNDVWIGRGAVILSGLTIHDGAVVAAAAVVTRDVAPYAIVAGNPAREVRKRFGDDTINALLDIRWWDRPDEWIRANVATLCSDDVDAFARAHTSDGAGAPR